MLRSERPKTKIVWREFYNESALKQLEQMGTLPREEIELDIYLMDGEEIAAKIAEEINAENFEAFSTGGEIVILEPEEFAGTYDIHVDFQPVFHASRND